MKMIRNVTVATVDAHDTVIPRGAVVIEGEKILWVGREENCPYHPSQMEEVTDGLGDLLIPGIVNAHTHTVYFLTRGLGMDRDLKDWLTAATWPYLAALGPKDAYLGGMLGYAECLKSGVTSVIDNYYASAAAAPDNADALLTAMQDSGIRGVLARGYHDTPFNIPALFAEDGETAAREYDRLLNSWQGANRGRIDLWVSPVNLLYCSPASIRRVYEVARAYGTGIHTHVAEARFEVEVIRERYGKTFLEVMDEIGVLDRRFHSVHSVWLSEKEMELLAAAGGTVMFNPASNMLLASGIAPVETMLQKGVRVALGTDAPNNNQDMLESMKLAAILPRMQNHNPTAVSSAGALRMATIEGARAMCKDKLIGSIEAGKQADLVRVNMRSVHNTPVHDPVANLVYSANQSDVLDVWLAGERMVENGRLTHLDEEEIIREVNAIIPALKTRVAEMALF